MNLQLTVTMLNLRNGVNKMLFYLGPLGSFFYFPSDHSDHMETAQRSKSQRSLNVFCSDHNDRSDDMETSLHLNRTSTLCEASRNK